jgi:hypothetical protein
MIVAASQLKGSIKGIYLYMYLSIYIYYLCIYVSMYLIIYISTGIISQVPHLSGKEASIRGIKQV